MIDTGAVTREAARLRAHARHGVLCIDFDGTLAPIVPDPEGARPFPGAVELLERLARTWAGVALVSGRPAAFLAEHAAARGVRFIGLYGLQELLDGELIVDERLSAARPNVDAAKAVLRDDADVRASGAYLEDKGFAVGIHLRRVDAPERWLATIERTAHRIASDHDLEVVPGKLVWELRPVVRGDKGDAVRRVVRECGARAVVTIGDDVGDLPAFAATAALRADGLETLRVGVRSDDVPADVLEASDLVVDGPPGVRDFLELLTERNGGADLEHE